MVPQQTFISLYVSSYYAVSVVKVEFRGLQLSLCMFVCVFLFIVKKAVTEEICIYIVQL